MEIAIIADDLTGANDSGVQLAKRGFSVTVVIDIGENSIASKDDVVVYDTDSRGMSKEEAYHIVRETAERIRNQNFQVVFKKIDSTMRGNIGAEIDAVYDVFQPDFVIIAPAFPQNKRQVIGGYHYVDGRLLHETEVSADPITPVRESYIPKLLQAQTERTVALITHQELSIDQVSLIAKLKELKGKGIAYILFDSLVDKHLKMIVETVEQVSRKIVWVGSAGLSSHIPCPVKEGFDKTKNGVITIKRPVLILVGSVSRISRVQLNKVLSATDVIGVIMRSSIVVTSEEGRSQEIKRVYQEAHQALLARRHVVIYCSGDPQDVAEITRLGKVLKQSPAELGQRIAKALGDVAAKLVYTLDLDGVVLTGGDTAKQFCRSARIKEINLMGEIETGIPIGQLIGDKTLYAITKAGSFGSETVLLKALQFLQGGDAS